MPIATRTLTLASPALFGGLIVTITCSGNKHPNMLALPFTTICAHGSSVSKASRSNTGYLCSNIPHRPHLILSDLNSPHTPQQSHVQHTPIAQHLEFEGKNAL